MECSVSSKPSICPGRVSEILNYHYGLKVDVKKELKSFSAQNYLVSVVNSNADNHDVATKNLLVKILNTEEAPVELISWRFSIMDQVRSHGFVCQKLILTKSGEIAALINHHEQLEETRNAEYTLCVMEYLKGTELFHLAPWQPQLLRALGFWIAELRISFGEITISMATDKSSKSADENFCENAEWKLSNLTELRKHVLEEAHRGTTEKVIRLFEEKVLPVLDELPKGLIHGDLHDENILLLSDLESDVNSSGSSSLYGLAARKNDVKKIFGLIDFEDMYQSYCVIDLATVLCYFMIASKNDNILEISSYILSGYSEKVVLTNSEWNVLYSLVCGRYIQELALCEVEGLKQDTNDYLKTCFKDGWPQVELLIEMEEDHVLKTWQKACSKD